MTLFINLKDKAPPFKGGDPVFDSGVSFIYMPGYPKGTGNRLKICRRRKKLTGSNPAPGTRAKAQNMYNFMS